MMLGAAALRVRKRQACGSDGGWLRRACAALALVLAGAPAAAQDPRYCGPPERDARGQIKRSTAVRAAFVRLYPCPSTGEVTGACHGWAVDHVVPLAAGGCDQIGNLQWLPTTIKSCAAASGVPCKDRWERRVYAR